MTFHAKSLFYFLAFAAVLTLARRVDEGDILPALAAVGILAIVVVNGVLTFWPAIVGSDRHRR